VVASGVSVDMNFGNQDWGVKRWVVEEGGKSGELCVSEEGE
jgi:hypothetical protein